MQASKAKGGIRWDNRAVATFILSSARLEIGLSNREPTCTLVGLAPEQCLPDRYLALFTQPGDELRHLLPPLLQPQGHSAERKERKFGAQHMRLHSHLTCCISCKFFIALCWAMLLQREMPSLLHTCETRQADPTRGIQGNQSCQSHKLPQKGILKRQHSILWAGHYDAEAVPLCPASGPCWTK